MRFVLIGPAYPLRGGIAVFNARLYQVLRQRGHDVYALNFKRQYPALLFPGRHQEDHSRLAFRIPSMPILDSVNPITWLETARRAAARRPDAVVLHYWMPFFAPAYGVISRILRRCARVLWICHNITPHEKQPGGPLLNRLGLRQADAFVVMSEPVERDLLGFRPGARFRRVPHPVDVPAGAVEKERARAELGLPQDAPVLLFFGYVRPYKGLETLLRAFATVVSAADARLVVAGEFYEPLRRYEELAAELGIADRVRFYDEYVPNEQVGVLFAAADAVVLPYLTATQSGIIPMAYAYGRPVITTAVGGLPEMVRPGRTGLLVPPADPVALSDAILRFLERRTEVDWSHEVELLRREMSWGRLARALEELTAAAP